MRNLLRCFSENYDSGVIKIYNLFNLKNAKATKAIKALDTIISDYLFTKEINFHNAPVIFATGRVYDKRLKKQLKRYYESAKDNQKYYLAKIENKFFKFLEVESEENIYESYHPSYAFGYGNEMSCYMGRVICNNPYIV